MSAFTGIPSIELINLDGSSNATSRPLVYVDIAIKHPYIFRGHVIATGVPLQPLKETAPNLLQYLTIDGAQIVLPHSEAIDRDILLNLIDLIVDKHCSGEVLEIEMHELPQEPVKLIKLQVILELFGMDSHANSVWKQLLPVFETGIFTLTDVFWVYGALVPQNDTRWVPESTNVYLQLMAFNLLNADAEGTLHEDLRIFFLQEENKPFHLTHLLQGQFANYRLSRGVTVTDHVGRAISPCSSSSSSPDSAFDEGPIFPARWLSFSKPKEPPEAVDMEFMLPSEKRISENWDIKWDDKPKDVQNMAEEREALASLRRSQAFPEYVRKTSGYVEFECSD